MTTDDERRAVARRLREIADGYEEVSYFDLARTLGLGAVSRYGYDPDDVRRLADLIEPPTRCPHYHSGRHYCSVHEDMALIDRDALLALADEIYDTSCDYHGELSVSLGDIWGWAQAIRDALGVDDA